jgi:hypothetical protein
LRPAAWEPWAGDGVSFFSGQKGYGVLHTFHCTPRNPAEPDSP